VARATAAAARLTGGEQSFCPGNSEKPDFGLAVFDPLRLDCRRLDDHGRPWRPARRITWKGLRSGAVCHQEVLMKRFPKFVSMFLALAFIGLTAAETVSAASHGCNACAEPACGAAEPGCAAAAEPACAAAEPACAAAPTCNSQPRQRRARRGLFSRRAKASASSCSSCSNEPSCAATAGCGAEPGCAAEPACGACAGG
jgi:hypothetical protein